MTILKFLKLSVWVISCLFMGGVILPYLFSQQSTIAVLLGVVSLIAFIAIVLFFAGVKFK